MARLASETPLRLDAFVAALGGSLRGSGERLITGIVNDHREWRPGDLFVALKGSALDSHTFVPEILAQGGYAIVEDAAALGHGGEGIIVGDARRAISMAGALVAGSRLAKVKMVGVTGTNGKTTVTWILHHLLREVFGGSLRIGTLGTCAERRGEEPVVREDFGLTTPDPLMLYRMVCTAADHGIVHGVMEASSHALDQHRVDGLAFTVGIFTNLTRDHLDYHLTMERYLEAKLRLFDLVPRGGAAVLNRDSPSAPQFLERARERALRDLSFGRGEGSAVRIDGFVQDASGSRLALRTGNAHNEGTVINTGLIGSHNAENLAAVYATGVALGIGPVELARAMSSAPQVPGRLEAVGGGEASVFVDYAHTPDALEHALSALRPLTAKRLWVVFGCGGDRDRGKRPEMARVAERLADEVVVTSDNPRTEDPEKIAADIMAGFTREVSLELDRRRAIVRTLAKVGAGDVVLIAGKGHEQYQIIGREKHHFSDQEVVQELVGRRTP